MSFVVFFFYVFLREREREERKGKRKTKTQNSSSKKWKKNRRSRGNPAEKKFFDCIAAYAPVDNVVPGAKYPTILVTAGLHDPRVGYWEPAKVRRKKKMFFFPVSFFFSRS